MPRVRSAVVARHARAYQRQRYMERAALGLCVDCRNAVVQPAIPGQRRCAEHQAKQRRQRNGARYDGRRVAMSLRADQVLLLSQLLQQAQISPDLRVLVRHSTFGSLLQSVRSAAIRADARKSSPTRLRKAAS